MRGPFWNNGISGVTGEKPKFVTERPNFVNTVNSEGKAVTLTGVDADRFREMQSV